MPCCVTAVCSRVYLCKIINKSVWVNLLFWFSSLARLNPRLNSLGFHRNRIFNTIPFILAVREHFFPFVWINKTKTMKHKQWIKKVKASFKNTFSNYLMILHKCKKLACVSRVRWSLITGLYCSRRGTMPSGNHPTWQKLCILKYENNKIKIQYNCYILVKAMHTFQEKYSMHNWQAYGLNVAVLHSKRQHAKFV